MPACALQVWVYTSQEGVPGSGARPGVAVALVRGRATQEVGSVSVGITLNVSQKSVSR